MEKVYARIDAGIVAEVITIGEFLKPFQVDVDGGLVTVEQMFFTPVEERFHPGIVATLVDITGAAPMPQVGWSYQDGVFSAPASTSFAWIKASRWEVIKAERDHRRFNGGVQVGAHWFRSDAIATSEYNTLALMSASLPENTVIRAAWRTMDGATVDMTPALVRQILVAGFAQVAAIDDAAQAHKAAMEASPDPATYDYSAGWPQTYAEFLVAQE